MRIRSVALCVVLAFAPTALVACSSEAPPYPSAEPGPVPISSSRPPIPPTKATSQLFVSPTGDDANSGDQSAPLRTLSHAAELAKPGVEVRVADGTYQGKLLTEASGTQDARITYVAENKWGAKIVGDGDKGAAWRNNGDYVDVVGFDVSGSNTDGLTFGGSFGRMVNNRVHGFTRGNCVSTNNEGYTLHDIDVIGNVAFGCGKSELDHGIYVAHPRGVVANNISYGNKGYGIQCWHQCADLDVSHNLVFNNAEGGIVIGHPDDEDGTANGVVVSNNIVVHNGKDGIKESGETGTNNRYLNNLVWGNGDDNVGLNTGSKAGTIRSDPLFVDYKPDGSGDYRLQPSSPALGAGTDAGQLGPRAIAG